MPEELVVVFFVNKVVQILAIVPQWDEVSLRISLVHDPATDLVTVDDAGFFPDDETEKAAAIAEVDSVMSFQPLNLLFLLRDDCFQIFKFPAFTVCAKLVLELPFGCVFGAEPQNHFDCPH